MLEMDQGHRGGQDRGQGIPAGGLRQDQGVFVGDGGPFKIGMLIPGIGHQTGGVRRARVAGMGSVKFGEHGGGLLDASRGHRPRCRPASAGRPARESIGMLGQEIHRPR